MADVREREAVIDGIRAPLIEAGPGSSSEAALFVHGNPGSTEDWRGLIGATGEVVRSIAIDMPGFGQADKPSDFDHQVASYAAFLESARQQLGLERVHVVGHDFGGPFALLWALQHPDAFASAVLINTGVLVGYRWHRMARIWRTPLLGELVQLLASERSFTRGLNRAGPKPLPAADVKRMYRDYDRRTRRAVLQLYRATADPGEAAEGLSSAFRELDRPALVVWGRQDPFIGVEQAELQKRSFPRARVVVLDDCAHWPFLDDPAAVASEVTSFLREQLAASANVQ